jgi:hypothetical protein
MEIETFKDIDFTNFWNDSKYANEEYGGDEITNALIATTEFELGYKLPSAYIALMKLHNGGMPNKCYFPTSQPTSWAKDHIAITGIMGIGNNSPSSLCGDSGSQFWIDEWGYPNLGIYFCDCPSAGHDMIALDYTQCGTQGEPEVVHIDQEANYKKTFLAKNFETFIKGLYKKEL